MKIHKLFTDELWLEDTYYFLNLRERREYVVVPQPDDSFEFHPTDRLPFYSRRALVLEDNCRMPTNSVTLVAFLKA